MAFIGRISSTDYRFIYRECLNNVELCFDMHASLFVCEQSFRMDCVRFVPHCYMVVMNYMPYFLVILPHFMISVRLWLLLDSRTTTVLATFASRGVDLSPRLGDTQWPINPPTTVLLSFTFILSPLTIAPRNGVRSHNRCGTVPDKM